MTTESVAQRPTLTVVMPVFNEAANLVSVLDGIRVGILDVVPGSDLLVIDDHSTDDSPAVLAAAVRDDRRITVIRNEVNLGHGPSVRRGWDTSSIGLHAHHRQRRPDRSGRVSQPVGRRRKLPIWCWVRGCSVATRGIVGSSPEALGHSRLALARRRLRDANTPFKLIRTSLLRHLTPGIPPTAFAPFRAAHRRRMPQRCQRGRVAGSPVAAAARSVIPEHSQAGARSEPMRAGNDSLRARKGRPVCRVNQVRAHLLACRVDGPTRVLVTGGAGFIGTNAIRHLVHDGADVTAFDNFRRPGAERNLELLQRELDGQVRVVVGDVRDADAVDAAVANVDAVLHLAGQTAVTTSLVDPRGDMFDNAVGTFNVVDAARRSPHHPMVLYASTNKVYGSLDDLAIVEEADRYRLFGSAARYPRVQTARLCQPIRMLEGRGRVVRSRLRPHLRGADRGVPSVVHLWRTPTGRRRPGLACVVRSLRAAWRTADDLRRRQAGAGSAARRRPHRRVPARASHASTTCRAKLQRRRRSRPEHVDLVATAPNARSSRSARPMPEPDVRAVAHAATRRSSSPTSPKRRVARLGAHDVHGRWAATAWSTGFERLDR